MDLKPGTRLHSQVCAMEIIVVRAPASSVALSCGGVPMIDHAASPAADVIASATLMGGSLLGKRYTMSQGGLEVLVTKAGEGSLGVGPERLVPKEAKPLPSSD